MLLSLCVALWLFQRDDIYGLSLRFALVFVSPFSIAITSLGLCTFRVFVLRVMICVSFLFLWMPGTGCDLCLWDYLDFSFYRLVIQIVLINDARQKSNRNDRTFRMTLSFTFQTEVLGDVLQPRPHST